MGVADAAAIADAILYEGYMLYPYRRSALKNRAGWTFGVIGPRAEGHSRNELRFECLVVDGPATEVTATLRFLVPQSAGDQQAVPREVSLPLTRFAELRAGPVVTPFAFASADEGVAGQLELAALDVAAGVKKLAITVANTTSAPAHGEQAQSRSMVSTHVLLGIRDGEFVPLRDPAPSLAAAAEACRQDGLWPILVG